MGVTQSAVSRWERGQDEPSPEVFGRLRDLVDKHAAGRFDIEQRVLERMPGLRALLDWDGMTMLAMTRDFKAIWPHMENTERLRLGDHLADLSRDLFNDSAFGRSIMNGEIALFEGVSDRHLIGPHPAFRHHWAAVYRRIGLRHCVEISYHACVPDAELGLRHVLRVDELA